MEKYVDHYAKNKLTFRTMAKASIEHNNFEREGQKSTLHLWDFRPQKMVVVFLAIFFLPQ